METFTRQLMQHQPILVGLAIQFTKNEETAKDLVQDTLLRALNHRKKFSAGTNLLAWLSTIMRNLFINSYRKKMRRKTEPCDLQSLDFLSQSAVENEGPGHLEWEEVEHFIDQMDEKFSTPLYMLAEGFSYKEMAEELDAPIGTVKSRVFYGRKILEKRGAMNNER